MARKPKHSAPAAALSAALRNLVEAVARKVMDEVRREIPERNRVRRIERQLARLSRRLGSGGRASGAKRVGRPRSDRRCTVRGCSLPHVAQGLCSKHYQARRRQKLRKEG
jgi:hypothetical protein